MPFVPSVASDQTPPSQVPEYSKSGRLGLFAAMLDGDARAIAEQDDISGLPNHLVELIDLVLGAEDQLVQQPRESFSSRGVRMRGALPSTGSTPWLFADLCQELETSVIAGGGRAPSATA